MVCVLMTFMPTPNTPQWGGVRIIATYSVPFPGIPTNEMTLFLAAVRWRQQSARSDDTGADHILPRHWEYFLILSCENNINLQSFSYKWLNQRCVRTQHCG